jgi:polyvinyl alcohol dehydrogenase (cytochrome)
MRSLTNGLPRARGCGCAILFLCQIAIPVTHAAGPAEEPQATPEPQARQETGDVTEFTRSMEAKSEGAVDRENSPGARVYKARCAQCHEGQVPKAPARTFVQFMRPEAIYDALTTGIMQPQAAGLSEADRRHVAEYLSGIAFGAPAAPEAPRCKGEAARFDLTRAPRIRGWGIDDGNTHFVPGEVARLTPADIPKLELKWAFAYPNALRARSRPTFAMGALFVGSQGGAVYALDAKTGCVRWTYETSAEVRTPIVIEPWVPGQKPAHAPLAFFGDLIGRAYAVNATTGQLVWRVKADDHPSATITGSPVYHEGVLYVPVSSLEEASADPNYPCCTFRGSILALDAATGSVRWKTYTIDEPARERGTTPSGTKVFGPSGAPIWNSPTVDARRGLLYVGTGNNYSSPANDRSNAIIAFDLASGAVRWRWQVVAGDVWNVGCMIGNDNCPEDPGPDYDIGAGTMLLRTRDGRERIYIGLKSGEALAIDPDKHDGRLWARRVGRGSIQGGIQFGMASDGERLYVPIADMRQSFDASSSARDAAEPRPGLYALDPATGDLVWSALPDDVCRGREFCDPGILASIVAIPGAVFAGHMDGRIRAYDSTDGRVLWEYDSSGSVRTLSGAEAHGGSVGGGGPVVYDGMLYANSGYGLYFHMPGNVLLAFSVNGR